MQQQSLAFLLLFLFSQVYARHNVCVGEDTSTYKVISKQGELTFGVIDTSIVYDKAEVMPSFPGGAKELMMYMAKNIKYPKVAREKGLEGKVVVKFIVKKDGTVVDPVILKDGVGGGCAEETKRVILNIPKWIPATQDGEPVDVYFVFPVTFKR